MAPTSISQTFPSSAVASAAGIDTATLKNWTRRNILLYPGQEPRAGHVRMLPLFGAYEVATLAMLKSLGLSLETARATWKALMELQFSAEREPKSEGDGPMSFDEIQQNRAARWTAGANNEHPKSLPPFLREELDSNKIVAISFESDALGDDRVSRVYVSLLDRNYQPTWGLKLTALLKRGRQPMTVRRGVMVVDFGDMVQDVNRRLFDADAASDNG